MARQILPIAGAIIGNIIAPGIGGQVGYVVGSLIGNAVDPIQVQGNKIGDNQLQTAAEGGTRAIVFGKGCIRATCLLERGNRIVKKQRQRSGKGGGPVTVNERVYWTFAIGLGEDLVGGAILRIWEGEKLVADFTPTSPIPEETAEFARKFRFYDGAEDQLPDPDLEAIHGVGNAPYYRGTAYVVFPNFDLTDYREAIPTYRWEVAKSVEHASWPGYSWSLETATGWASGGAVSTCGDLVIAGGSGTAQTYWAEIPGTWHTVTAPFAMSMFATSGSVVVGSNTGNNDQVAYGNGKSWVAATLPSPVNKSGIAYGNGLFIISGSGGVGPVNSYACVGTPSTSWTQHLIYSGSEVVNGIGYGDGKFVAWTGAAKIFVSTTGDSWIEKTPAATFNNIFWAAGPRLWVGISGGIIYTSPDLDTWTLRGTFAASFTSGAWSDTLGVAVVVGQAGAGRYSDDCITWTSMPLVGDSSYSDVVWSQAWGKFVASGNAPERIISSDSVAGSDVGLPVPLSDIVVSLHRRCGHALSDMDAAELTDMVAGVVFEQSVSGAEAINSILGGYFADPADYDGKIHYIKRGKPVVRTLTYDDLIDEPETTQRQNPIEYPRKLHLFAQTSWTGYAATKSTSSRSSPDLKNVVGEVSVAIPVTFDGPDEPAQIAAKLHKVNWADAEGEIVWPVTDEHLDLVPADCVGLSLRGRLTRARITGIEDNPGVRKLTLRVDRQSAYTSDVTGVPLPLPTPPQPSILSPTVNAYLDIPALQDADDTAAPVYYDAMSGQADVWPGSVLQRSLDGGANYGNAASANVNAVMGLLQNTVSAASPYYTDATNEIIVKLYMDDEIDGLTNQQFLTEQGAFALSWDDAGVRRWEVMQYRDAEEVAEKTYRLTTLHRGRLNSATAAHPVGSLFVLLDTAVRVVDAQSSWIGTDLTHRAVTNGLSPETAMARTEPYTAQSQTEWPVAHVLLDHAGNDLHIDIVPRHRFGTSLNPIRSINWTGYRITATDGSNTAGVDTTSDIHTFDVTGWASPITVTVAQLNRITGAGPSAIEAIP